MKKCKILVMINLLILILVTFSSCKSNKSIDLSTDSVANYIKDNIVFKDELQKIEDIAILKKLYPTINTHYISEFSVYTSASGATAEELSIFKLNDSAYNDDIKHVIKLRASEQINNFKNYVPEEVFKIKNSVINENQNIVTYVSCDTPDDIDILLKKLYNSK